MIEKLPLEFTADHRKITLLYFEVQRERISALCDRIQILDHEQASVIWEDTLRRFGHRHRNFEQQVLKHAEIALEQFQPKIKCSRTHKILLGAYLSKEYSTQAAALFNPSIVPHPDQRKLAPDALRFILAMRSTGEGHISSITFNEGVIHPSGTIEMAPDQRWQSPGQRSKTNPSSEFYSLTFDKEIPMQERILFPSSPHEKVGMEDLRLVRMEDEAEKKYFGTFTAYDGKHIRSKILSTNDFSEFQIQPLTGMAVAGKGIALFPRRIRGQYVATGRQDGVSMTIMYSDNLTHWDEYIPLQTPELPFEFTQLGNCGSPIETPEGWLLLTHAVGPLRRYVLSATLVDLDEPHKIIGKLNKPLMEPSEEEREGYVPNVLYTCGWLKHRGNIYLPYAYSDQGCGFARIPVKDLLTMLK